MTNPTPDPRYRWGAFLDDRERRLVQNCLDYAARDPAGLPGHNLILIIDKLARMLDVYWDEHGGLSRNPLSGKTDPPSPPEKH